MSYSVFHADFCTNNYKPQLVIPELAREMGLEESIILNQVHYWIQKCGHFIEGKHWIYNTFEEWNRQFSYMSLSKIKRIFYALEKRGLIFSRKMNVHKSNHTKWYALNYDMLSEIMESIKLKEKKSRKAKKTVVKKSELSLCQNDTIITKTISTKESMSKSKEKKNRPVTFKSRTFSSEKEKQKDDLRIDQEASEKMLGVWNELLPKEKTVLTTRRAGKLTHLFETVLDKDMEKWREFCIAVNSSKFLMGEKTSFKARFDWLTEEEVAVRVIGGEFDIGDRIPDYRQKEEEQRREAAKKVYELKLEEEKNSVRKRKKN